MNEHCLFAVGIFIFILILVIFTLPCYSKELKLPSTCAFRHEKFACRRFLLSATSTCDRPACLWCSCMFHSRNLFHIPGNELQGSHVHQNIQQEKPARSHHIKCPLSIGYIIGIQWVRPHLIDALWFHRHQVPQPIYGLSWSLLLAKTWAAHLYQ